MAFRIGFGFDVHRLEAHQELKLGGVSIPHSKGAVGHSDADTLIHAICDALLGAAGQRDIGFHFPDTDPAWKGKDSAHFLLKVNEILHSLAYSVVNIDATVVLQKPKISAYIPDICRNLASLLNLDETSISVKAKTSEGIGYVGREEGVQAYAVALLEKR
ncbi:MAG TPA: 2-C-methyl-D-erythritol 2,4-cyclodiphosphate synthase [Bacteroidales bacterium]|nr:2-C-methyl-D-erythritol 2,4-cyclodiphosphate synthase [Bacteroidales bacterium]HSA43190.1 2-C-methyl-D-erythritol 2,4-cyclodiphosphate synthase [Bacteroidales bacterium]